MFYGYVTNIIGYTSNQTDNRSVLLTWTVTGPRNPEILTFLFEGVDAYAVSLFIATEHKSGSDMMLTIIDADEQATRPQNSRKVNDFYISPTGYSASKLEVTKKIEQPTQGYITEVDYIAKNLGRDDYFIFLMMSHWSYQWITHPLWMCSSPIWWIIMITITFII
nr:hypothetical protein [Providencia stuartii]